MLRFETRDGSFLIRTSSAPELSCLSFPEKFQRARKNSVDLFPELVGRRVTGVRQYRNERSFSIAFSDDYVLLFKMHGNRTNLVLFHNGEAIQRFRNNVDADLRLDLRTLDRDIDWSYEAFQQHADDLKRLYFTFGKLVWRYLSEQGFFDAALPIQWDLIQSLRAQFEHPPYYITLIDGKPALSLIETGQIREVLTHPIAAANAYYHAFIHDYAFDRERHSALATLRTQINAGQAYCDKNARRLSELQRDLPYKVWADLIMANLHRIPKDAEDVTLENFYAGNRPERIKLKKALSPQKNAELYYRKAKNQHIEIDQLKHSIVQKQREQEMLQEKIAAIESASDLKTLRSITEGVQQKSAGRASEALPFHEFEFMGYKIWVGRNAQSNDALTLKFSYKDDLWLHAKDVTGSHVLIKHQAGKNFPKDVIAYAASLAAHYSKRKNEALAPVIVTPKKFVRKRKGAPAGAVVVERETIIMAEPHRTA